MPKKQTQWTRAFNERAYDRLSITIPKGRKGAIEAVATAYGESINGFVNRLLMEASGLTLEDWKAPPPKPRDE